MSRLIAPAVVALVSLVSVLARLWISSYVIDTLALFCLAGVAAWLGVLVIARRINTIDSPQQRNVAIPASPPRALLTKV